MWAALAATTLAVTAASVRRPGSGAALRDGPPFGPQPPAPFPAKYETKFYTQPRDHFNYFNNYPEPGVAGEAFTFQQRYLSYDAHWKGPPHPIVLVPCQSERNRASGFDVSSLFPSSYTPPSRAGS
jgi:hypothetical protein